MVRKGLRLKIFTSFLMLISILLLAGLISMFNFHKLSNNVYSLIDEDYNTIREAKKLILALEREDSGILMLLMGEFEHGRSIINQADSIWGDSFMLLSLKYREDADVEILDSINTAYNSYKNIWRKPIVETNREGNIEWYRSVAHLSFVKNKDIVNKLIDIKERDLFEKSHHLKERSLRAMLPGIVSIIAAIIFAFILNFFIVRYFVSPLVRMTEAVRKYKTGKNLNIEPDTNDELEDLGNEIKHLVDRLEK